MLPLTGAITITSPFGYRPNPFTQEEELHNGVDFAAVEGTAVHAVHDGVITETGQDGYSGIYVRLQLDNGYMVTLAHLSQICVEKGQQVARGDVVAYSGNTGQSSGPHLHYTLRKDGQLMNPMNEIYEP